MNNSILILKQRQHVKLNGLSAAVTLYILMVTHARDPLVYGDRVHVLTGAVTVAV